jgi:hypothetical protein
MVEDTPASYAPPALVVRFGIKIFRVSLSKVPFAGTHGHLDATSDLQEIAEMEKAHPRGLWAMATGKPSGRVVIDIDWKMLPDGTVVWGLDSLDAEGIVYWSLDGPTTHTPRGGFQQWCEDPGCYVKSGALVIDGRKIASVDVKGDGGFVCLPPGPKRWWDPLLGPDTPLPPLPAWAIMADAQPTPAPAIPAPHGDYTAYGEAAVDRIVDEIRSAGHGNQEEALNSGAFAIGQLVAGEEIAASYALRLFDWLAPRVQSLDAHRPWHPGEVQKKLQHAYLAGQRRPRSAS